jgi:hypothetical protein
MGSDKDPLDSAHADPAPVGSLQLDDVQLPIYDLEAFIDADITRVSSFSTNFGSWALPPEVGNALASGDGRGELEWIHDTGELVLLGGVPTEGTISADVTGFAAVSAELTPAFLGGEAGATVSDGPGMVREYFKSDVLPPGSRVALMAHIAHGPAAHELLWGWHRQHRTEGGWEWLVERLARIESQTGESEHLG